MFKTAVLTFFALLPVMAQSSSLQGILTDAQGGVIPDAVITITNLDTAASRKVISTPQGSYAFAQVPPGTYTFEIQKPGFGNVLRQIVLQVDVPASLNITLEVGEATTQTVNVEETIATVNTQNATIGNAFTQTQVRELPLQTRNVVELLSLQPGVTETGEVLGAKRDQNNVTLDGVDVNDQQAAGMTSTTSQGLNAALPVPLDSVQEFRVTIAGQGADQGRSAGGQVSLVTKSGSNQFHGSVYEFHRNKVTAANEWFANRSGIPRENLIRNQYGASLGGRIIKDRAFFFVNWEDRKDRSARVQSRDVPSELLKQGIVQFRQNDGTIGQLSRQEVMLVDPKGLGYSSAMQNFLSQYPTANDPQTGSDRGLNFATYRFNAPLTRNDRAYVAKLDFNLDQMARHTLMLRGTLADNSRDEVLSQFPGQDAAAKNLDNSKGLAARYTAVISPTLVNVFSFGYTRLGIAQSGTPGASLTFAPLSSLQNYGASARAFSRFIPTTNLVNDLTWMKEKHQVQMGVNIRIIQNDRSSYATSYPSYSFGRNTLQGLGSDISDAVNTYLKQRSGNSSLALAEVQPTQQALGVLYGIINSYSGTYNFGVDGKAIPFGESISRSFATKEYEFYIQDTWKVRTDLTLTYGVRYGSYGVPYERNGVQVVPRTGLDVYMAERVGASMAGIPGHAMPNAMLTYDLGGPVNNGAGWYRRDNNNWAPRFNLAYAPVSDGFWGRLFGQGSVIRAGAAMMYDRYGSDMVVNFDQSGSPGLATSVTQPQNTNFTTAHRYAEGVLPNLPSAPAASYPFTPPAVIGGFGGLTGVYPDLRAPYSYLLNLTYARPLSKQMTIEVGYIGRLARKSLVKVDVFQPLTQFKDPKSGQTWAQASGMLRDHFENKTPISQIPKIDFFENVFSRAANLYVPGSATQNYFHTIYNRYGGSDLDALNDMDRERRPDGSCISTYGCNTFFAMQNAGNRAWTNAGRSAFHGAQFVLRRAVSNGWGFDFNYTLSRSMDLSSTAESASGAGGGVIQDTFNPNAAWALSSFDARHNITANGVVELPFGKGKYFFRNLPTVADHIIGGWQVSGLWRLRSGTPLNITNGGIYPTNYLSAALGMLRPGQTMPENGVGYNQAGNPSIFRQTNAAAAAFMGQYPGTAGKRSIMRGPGMTNFDLSLSKHFTMPFEGHRLQLRAEAFNAFNNVNFSTNGMSLSLQNPSTFGQFSEVMPARVMQFALRYTF